MNIHYLVCCFFFPLLLPHSQLGYILEIYKSVIHACSLEKDKSFLHGDQTIIGGRCINLSSGQKQHVQLARPLYQDAEIYLLYVPSLLLMHTQVRFEEDLPAVLHGTSCRFPGGTD